MQKQSRGRLLLPERRSITLISEDECGINIAFFTVSVDELDGICHTCRSSTVVKHLMLIQRA
jgi:hypothetical protein